MLVTCWMFLLEVVLAKSDVNINITCYATFRFFQGKKKKKERNQTW